jgi:hypothetical protein
VTGKQLRYVGLMVLAASSIGCAQKGPPPLYMWENFPQVQYQALLRESPSTDDQVRLLEAHMEKARGAQAALPPGLRPHLALLHLNAGRIDQARELLAAEKLAFPEAAAYVDQLLKRVDGMAKPATDKVPA